MVDFRSNPFYNIDDRLLLFPYVIFWRNLTMSKKFIVETSARHVHVTKEALEILFGKGASLQIKRTCPSRVSLLVKNGSRLSARKEN